VRHATPKGVVASVLLLVLPLSRAAADTHGQHSTPHYTERRREGGTRGEGACSGFWWQGNRSFGGRMERRRRKEAASCVKWLNGAS
jgi:hypothetical protein